MIKYSNSKDFCKMENKRQINNQLTMKQKVAFAYFVLTIK
jgi:hypothetical protein